jgi:hypothetical protein
MRDIHTIDSELRLVVALYVELGINLPQNGIQAPPAVAEIVLDPAMTRKVKPRPSAISCSSVTSAGMSATAQCQNPLAGGRPGRRR